VRILKGRKTILVILIALGLSIPAVVSDSDSFIVEYQFNATQTTGGLQIVEDTTLQEIPGTPLIPYRAARILLPQGTKVKDVKVKTSNPVVQKGIDIPWGQPPCTFSDEPVMVNLNEEIYRSDNEYPTKVFEVVSVDSFRGFQILNVILYPIQYMPQSGTVKFYEKLTVHVQVTSGPKNELYRGLQCDKEDVKTMVNNPEMIKTYEDSVDIVPLSENYEYIIITNDSLESEFQKLADYKALFVEGTNVYTVSWIYSNYTGRDNPEKIRNFIKDRYENHGTMYVLLGGDVAVVPCREFYASIGFIHDDIAADMYYAHLDGTFNDDNDERWAEPGEVDWYPEVAVGRAPVETVAEAQNFVDKVKKHECLSKSKVCQFHQARIADNNNPDSRCLAWNCDDWVPPGYTKKYLFEEDQPVTKELWISVWDSFDCLEVPLVIQHMGDSPTCDPACYEINHDPQILWCCSDVPSLINSCYPWHTSPASYVGKFTHDDCLAECYVKDDCGAIACYMNDSYGWCSSNDACMYSGEFIEMQFKALFYAGKEKFGDLLNQSKIFMVSSAQSNSVYRWCFYEINLIGDPEIPCLTRRSCVNITNPEDGSEVSGTVNITADTCPYITRVEFWIDKNRNGIVDDGDLYCSDTDSPFECPWDTTTYPEGEEFSIWAYCYESGVYKGYDNVKVTVSNHHIDSPLYRSRKCIGETVIITTSEAEGIDTVEFYLIWITNGEVNGQLLCTDTAPPFECSWITTTYSSGWYTIRADAYSSGELKNVDQILVKLNIC
jgi:hypothetical protein